jgi:EAL domain-containing protein (putative c-di-GMP-specific phosphodiesterase class I)
LPAYTFAFQPIVDVHLREVHSYEALIRGTANQSAYVVLQQVPVEQLHFFDERVRVEAILMAAHLGIDCLLNVNFLPQALCHSTTSIVSTLEAADRARLSLERIVIEITEGEIIEDQPRFADLINEFRGLGLKVAIDDFGAGYAGLNLLADFQPDYIKLDMKLIRGIGSHGPRQAIVRAVTQACLDLGIDVIAEGVENVDEYGWLAGEGLRLFQGYLFAKPALETFPPFHYPQLFEPIRREGESDSGDLLAGSGSRPRFPSIRII